MKNVNTKFSLMYDLIAKALNITQRILIHSENDEINLVMQDLDQREGLIGIIKKLQDELELLPDNIKSKYWTNEIIEAIDLIRKYDDKIIANLQSAKKSTNTEIANIFKNKESFKGYNLNNLK